MDGSPTTGKENQPQPDEVFDAYLAQLDRGEAADFEALCEQNPSIAQTLRRMKSLFSAVDGSPDIQPTSPQKSNRLYQQRTDRRSQSPQPKQHAAGDTIGDFQLVECLGLGGMGEVWEAIQLSLSRRVAIKFLLTDRVNTLGLDFFGREARAGGRLEHKGIVSVYSCGETDGVYWIAMELVPGGCDLRRSLDALAKEDELPDDYYAYIAEFTARTADALEAVHQAKVIHRDLKPGNILVTPDVHPKISDFGLAKLVDEASLSMIGDMAGTYFYMSPEQVASKRAGIDARTDIFSLGVVLYEMLTFVRPFDGDTTQQVTGKIMWEDPVDPQMIRSRIPRDLAIICGKAMEKDPSQRYQSMAAFAADIRRHLAGEPIWARPSSIAARAVKWARRNPTKCVATLVASIAMVVISTIAWQLYISKQQAEKSRQRAEHIAEFQGKMLQGLDAFAIGQVVINKFEQRLANKLIQDESSQAERERILSEFRSLALRASTVDVAKDIIDEAILTPATTLLADEFTESPATEATLREALARVYNDIGLMKKAQEQHRRALELHLSQSNVQATAIIEANKRMAGTCLALDQNAESERYIREALSGAQSHYGPEHVETLKLMVGLATVLRKQGKADDASIQLDAVLEMGAKTLAPGHKILRQGKAEQAGLCEARGDAKRAGELYQEVLDESLQYCGENHKDTLSARFMRARWLHQQGQIDVAGPLYKTGAIAAERIYGREHPQTLMHLAGVGAILRGQAKREEALALYQELCDVGRRLLGNHHGATMAYVTNQGALLFELERFDEARPLMTEAVTFYQSKVGQQKVYRQALFNLALLEYKSGALKESEARFRELLEQTPPGHPQHEQCVNDVEAVVAKRKQIEAAGKHR
jgi:serine/threonine protein kinase